MIRLIRHIFTCIHGPMTTETDPTIDILLPLTASHNGRSISTEPPSTITDEEHRANAEFLAGAYALNTGLAYRSQLKAWVNWCRPAQTVTL